MKRPIANVSSHDERSNKRSKEEDERPNNAGGNPFIDGANEEQVRRKQEMDERVAEWFTPDKRELNLCCNGLGADDAAAIGKALETNTSLTTLDLSFNRLGDIGGAAIGKALETNTTLTTLNLSVNRLSAGAGAAIGKALQTNTSLTTLDLSFNRLRAGAGAAIGKALQTNTSLTTLDLSGNFLDEALLAVVHRFLQRNITLLVMRRLRTFLLGTLKPSHTGVRKTSSPVLMLNQDVLGMIASYVIATPAENIQ